MLINLRKLVLYCIGMSHFNFNGKIVAATTAIGPENRGLRYGDGLFETIKMINGKLLLEDDHFARLWKGLQVLQFDLQDAKTLIERMFRIELDIAGVNY